MWIIIPKTASWAFFRTSTFLSSRLAYRYGMQTNSSSFGMLFARTVGNKYQMYAFAATNGNNESVLGFILSGQFLLLTIDTTSTYLGNRKWTPMDPTT